MSVNVSIKLDGSEKLKKALAELADGEIKAAALAAVKDAAWHTKKVLQSEMRKVFDRATPFVLKSVQVEIDEDAPSARILPTYFGNNPVDPQHILQAQEFGGQRRHKRIERLLQQTGHLPAGWYIVPGQGANLDQWGNISRGQLVQILSQLRAQTVAGSSRNMAHGKRGIKAQRKAGGRFFVMPPGRRAQPGVYQREFIGNNITPVLIFVRSATYQPRLGLERIAAQAGLAEYLDRRTRYHIYRAVEAKA